VTIKTEVSVKTEDTQDLCRNSNI